MKYIKSFTEFLNESDSLDYDKVASVFSILSKYYESDKPFYTDALNFVLQEEIRNWAIIRDEVELEKTKSEDCFYKLIFDLSEKQYLLEIKFKIYSLDNFFISSPQSGQCGLPIRAYKTRK